jgi:hypothetical protein
MILNLDEDKCVNKGMWILNMDYKRQTTVLSIIFVLVGMVFIVPAMTEKALAIVHGEARTQFGVFYGLKWGIAPPARFTVLPTVIDGHRGIIWETTGFSNGISGSEHGRVVADVGPPSTHFQYRVNFDFSNPHFGRNTCSVPHPILPPDVKVSCDISQGNRAFATYLVEPRGGSSANGADTNSGDEGDNSGDTP